MAQLTSETERQLIHAFAKGSLISNIEASTGLSKEFLEEFSRTHADEICRKRGEIKEDFNTGREEGRFYGIDVSSWQGVIEWNRVKSSRNRHFAMLRAAYGLERDDRFEENYREAVKAGIPVGAYLYSLALNEQEAAAEADFMLELIRGKDLRYPVALDIEERSQARLGKERVSAIAEAFCSRIQSAGYYAMIYSYESFLTSLLDESVLRKYDIWAADIGATPSISYGIHQYSFRGQVEGIKGGCDLDVSLKNYPEIISQMKSTDSVKL
ncbi:glycoside hydrolase family 25 protein [Ruminococcus sp. Marseille-P6503]|uniref:glycoside hydrolase family 25 protein n=1 Tax=Ruminococcus sp. Marseille-P6503 TaxID=2364796 RepID=UPI0013DE4955|nr:glycoside hydrolase family 25 protein [Ruminococcus sp. Marseille-P6503]